MACGYKSRPFCSPEMEILEKFRYDPCARTWLTMEVRATCGKCVGLCAICGRENPGTVGIRWYSHRYDAFFREKNQFSIEVPHVKP